MRALRNAAFVVLLVTAIATHGKNVSAFDHCPNIEGCTCMGWGPEELHGFYIYCQFEECPYGTEFCDDVRNACPSGSLEWCDTGSNCEAACEPLECC